MRKILTRFSSKSEKLSGRKFKVLNDIKEVSNFFLIDKHEYKNSKIYTLTNIEVNTKIKKEYKRINSFIFN